MSAAIAIGPAILELVRGDITRQRVDAIVNAANARLAGGSGVDGAIHRAGGPSILAACRALPADDQGRRCPTGEARTTEAGNLPARFVIHAVGPVYDPRYAQKAEQHLRSAYVSSLKEADAHACASVAFPAISAGAYGYPLDEAARIAVTAVASTLRESPTSIRLARFVLFSDDVYDAFGRALGAL